jgi:hypothetical protein
VSNAASASSARNTAMRSACKQSSLT